MLAELNNRDWAILTIVAVVLIAGLAFGSSRLALGNFLRNGFKLKLVALMVAGWAYAVAGVYLLNLIGLWSTPVLKDTLIWILLTSPAIAFKGVSQRDPNSTFRTFASGQFKAILLFQLVFNTYTMAYWAELIWVVATSLLVLMILAAERMEDGRPAAGFLKGLQVMLGLGMVVFLGWSLFHRPSEVFSAKGFHTFLMPIFLSLWMLPLGYALSVYAGYENLFIKLKMGKLQPFDVRFYVRCKLIEIGGINASKLRRIDRLAGSRLRWPEDHDGVDSMFASLAETLSDPVLDEPGDFVWPDEISRSDKPPFKSMAEYLTAIAPLLDECTKHDAQARSWIAEYFSGELSATQLHSRFKGRLSEIQRFAETVAGLPDCSRRIRKADSLFQSYVSTVECLYHYVATSFPKEDRREAGDARLRFFSEESAKDWEKLRAAIEKFCPRDADETPNLVNN